MSDEDWDQAAADALHGATVLVGLTYHEPGGVRTEQFFGTVMETGPDIGVLLRLEGSRSGEFFTLPPDLTGFVPAEAGAYTLQETGEVVVDPDYTSVWTVTPPTN